MFAENLVKRMKNYFGSDNSSSSSESSIPIQGLPDDILEEILIRIPGVDLFKNVVLVCRQFKSIIDMEAFWSRKCQRDQKLTKSQLQKLLD